MSDDQPTCGGSCEIETLRSGHPEVVECPGCPDCDGPTPDELDRWQRRDAGRPATTQDLILDDLRMER